MTINNHIIACLEGPAHRYLSLDGLISDDPNDHQNFNIEYLNRQQPSGMPPHQLILKVGVVVMLLRNLRPEDGLSNGTRFLILQMLPNVIVVRIISESHRGEVCFIPRLELTNTDITLPFILKRHQFPIIPAYAMTINKSQGQTIERVGLYLKDVVFAHGQLYVAMSRCHSKENIKVIFL